MKGSPKVIEHLNKALREELTAINQYFLHAEMCENWGYEKLSDYIKKQSIGEMKHAEALMERLERVTARLGPAMAACLDDIAQRWKGGTKAA